MNDNKRQAKSPIKNFSCFRELAEKIILTKTHSNILKNTSCNHLFKIIFEYENFRDFVFRQATETLEHKRYNHYYLSTFCFDHCYFRNEEYLNLDNKLYNEVKSIHYKNIKSDIITLIILFNNKTSLIYYYYYDYHILPKSFRLINGTDKFTFSKDVATNNLTSFNYISKKYTKHS